jgi:hypothetical protein
MIATTTMISINVKARDAGERTRLACRFRRPTENIVSTLRPNVLVRQNEETLLESGMNIAFL